MYKNPVFNRNFADPFILHAGNTWYAYSTNVAMRNVQMIKSKDLVHWKDAGDAMPITARWISSDIWAPEVDAISPHKYVLYYSGRYTDTGHECVGHATASSPAGPFRDMSKKPWICQSAIGGDIDVDGFKDTDGKRYVYWKNDGNAVGEAVYLWGQRLSSDGLKLQGKPVKMTDVEQPWEGQVVEAPSMWKHSGKYFLFFAGGAFDTSFYASGYATCKGPLGPCKQAQDTMSCPPKTSAAYKKSPAACKGPANMLNPILHTDLKLCKTAAGPGHQAIFTDRKGQTWIAYHAWDVQHIGDDAYGRKLYIDRLDWKSGLPVVHGPTCSRQPAPAA